MEEIEAVPVGRDFSCLRVEARELADVQGLGPFPSLVRHERRHRNILRGLKTDLLTYDNYLRPRLNALAPKRLLIMERDQNSASAASCLDNSFKLAVARDLQRQFSSVLTEPLPSDLKRFIALLETRPRSRQRKSG